MTSPSVRRLVFKIHAKRVGALMGLLLIIGFGGRGVWTKYDPTWDHQKALSKVRYLAAHSSSLDLRPVSQATEPYFAHRIPLLLRYHPKYFSPPRSSPSVNGFFDSSAYFLFESPKGGLSVYVHFHSGRAAAFSVLYPPGLSEKAPGFAKEIEDAFPGLTVHLEESSHPALKIQTDL